MVAIPPARELADLESVAALSGLTAGAAALPNKPLNQELVAPNSSTSLGGIKQPRDVCEHLCLVHPVEDDRHRF